MTPHLSRPERLVRTRLVGLVIAVSHPSYAQQADDLTNDESTIVYEAGFFAEYSPVSVNDMIDRIPGISLALNNRSSNSLGSGGGEILINCQRTTSKSNAGRSQLSRIAADQVDYIKIIRGTSDEMDIRGGGQVINIVLLDAESRSRISTEVNMDRSHDGSLNPDAKLSYTGQTNVLGYF